MLNWRVKSSQERESEVILRLDLAPRWGLARPSQYERVKRVQKVFTSLPTPRLWAGLGLRNNTETHVPHIKLKLKPTLLVHSGPIYS